jgi:hypothetical protein
MNYKPILFWTSVFGWVISLLIIAVSFADIYIIRPDIMIGMAIGMPFVLLAVFYEKRKLELKEVGGLQRTSSQAKMLQVFQGVPKWVSALLLASVLYGVGVAFWLLAITPDVPVIVKDGFELHDKAGNFLEKITVEKYFHLKAAQQRTYMGVFIFVYGLGMAAFFPRKKA